MEIYLIEPPMPDAVSDMLPEKLTRQVTAEPDRFFVFGAVEQNTVCGLLVCYESEVGLVRPDYLFVEEPYRHRGIGKALFRELCQNCVNSSMPLYGSFLDDEEGVLFSFFSSLPAMTLTAGEDLFFRISRKDLQRPLLKTELRDPEVIPLTALSPAVEQGLIERLPAEIRCYLTDHEGKPYTWIHELCFLHIRERVMDAGVFFCPGNGDEEVELRFLYLAEDASAKILMAVLEQAREQISKRKVDLVAATVNDRSRSLIKKLYPLAERIGKTYEYSLDMNLFD